MAINYSTLLRLPKPDAGTQTWATYWHRLADMVDKFVGEVVTVTKVTGTTTLPDADGTADTAKSLVIRTAMTLTGNTVVVVPTRKRLYLVDNASSGSFTFTVKTASGTGVAVKQGHKQFVLCDGTNVVKASRLSGLITATEMIGSPITATNSGSVFGAGAVLAAALATGSVALSKFVGATGNHGAILYSATSAGFPWRNLARGSARQRLAMSTAVVPKPSWHTDPYWNVATSTQMAMSSIVGNTTAFTHGLAGLAAVTDVKSIVLRMICLSTDLGYAAGDMVFVDLVGNGASNQRNIATMVDSTTTVKVVVGSGPELPNKSTQAWTTITASKWALLISVYV